MALETQRLQVAFVLKDFDDDFLFIVCWLELEITSKCQVLVFWFHSGYPCLTASVIIWNLFNYLLSFSVSLGLSFWLLFLSGDASNCSCVRSALFDFGWLCVLLTSGRRKASSFLRNFLGCFHLFIISDELEISLSRCLKKKKGALEFWLGWH